LSYQFEDSDLVMEASSQYSPDKGDSFMVLTRYRWLVSQNSPDPGEPPQSTHQIPVTYLKVLTRYR
jgi:hypothetical protein